MVLQGGKQCRQVTSLRQAQPDLLKCESHDVETEVSRIVLDAKPRIGRF